MSQERKQVLEMLAEGKLSPEDAERLLDKLGKSNRTSEDSSERTNRSVETHGLGGRRAR